ncbi:MAG TPA: general stress protein [Candidatus Limnocylindrales bacterium]|nr:general stress protein [Candidatus Limnocylindrales bacterium]
MAISDRGFASMDRDKQREIASKGGKASGGNFANDRKRASEAGKKGGEAQSREAKAEGGRNSHRGNNS